MRLFDFVGANILLTLGLYIDPSRDCCPVARTRKMPALRLQGIYTKIINIGFVNSIERIRFVKYMHDSLPSNRREIRVK